MLDHLGAAARKVRRETGLRQIDIATTAGVSHVIISRFERGVAWPEQIDAIVDAYATEAGLRPHDLWARALELWG
jgi:transcriptional regulator with XRE-family HTH domain